MVQSPELAAAFRAESTDAEVRALVARFVRLGFPAPSVFYDDFRRTDGRARAALAASVERAEYRDELAVLKEMQKPLAIVHGAHDRIANGIYFAELELPTLWRRAIQWVPDVGHAPHWEAPWIFDEILRAFVAECRRSTVCHSVPFMNTMA
jgi:pimeloyl-ACP methyl ester carboxylesterase